MGIEVIEWIDINGNVCNDETVFNSDSLSSSDSNDEQADNALTDNNLISNIKTTSYYGLIKHWRTEIIIIVSVLIILIVTTICYLIYSTKLYRKYQNQTESSSLITEQRTNTKINERIQRKRKRVKRKRKKHKKTDVFYSVDCKGGDE